MSIMIGGKPKISSTLAKNDKEVSSKKDTSVAIKADDGEKKVKKAKKEE